MTTAHRVVHGAVWWALAGLLVVAGCTLSTAGSGQASAETVHANLTAKLAQAQAAHAHALNLWDRLIFGEPVSCQEAITVPHTLDLSAPERAAHPQAAETEQALNSAIHALAQAAASWDSECAETRDWVPVSTARNARERLLAASESLDTAAALLAAW